MKTIDISSQVALQKNAWTGKDNSSEPHRLKHQPSADEFRAQYQGGAFVSEHGSWDRSPLSGYEVTYVPFANGVPSGPKQSVVTGFYSENQKELYGAPVGLAQTADGALLIADDVGNAVWAVSASGS